MDINWWNDHLVARVFEEKDINKLCEDSPTCTRENLRLLLTIGILKS